MPRSSTYYADGIEREVLSRDMFMQPQTLAAMRAVNHELLGYPGDDIVRHEVLGINHRALGERLMEALAVIDGPVLITRVIDTERDDFGLSSTRFGSTLKVWAVPEPAYIPADGVNLVIPPGWFRR